MTRSLSDLGGEVSRALSSQEGVRAGLGLASSSSLWWGGLALGLVTHSREVAARASRRLVLSGGVLSPA